MNISKILIFFFCGLVFTENSYSMAKLSPTLKEEYNPLKLLVKKSDFFKYSKLKSENVSCSVSIDEETYEDYFSVKMDRRFLSLNSLTTNNNLIKLPIKEHIELYYDYHVNRNGVCEAGNRLVAFPIQNVHAGCLNEKDQLSLRNDWDERSYMLFDFTSANPINFQVLSFSKEVQVSEISFSTKKKQFQVALYSIVDSTEKIFK